MPTWDESKRRANIRRHKLDFAGIEVIWDGFTVTREDIRERYGERRFVTFGVLHDEVVVLVVDPDFMATGQYYRDFRPVSDADVRAALAAAFKRQAG